MVFNNAELPFSREGRKKKTFIGKTLNTIKEKGIRVDEAYDNSQQARETCFTPQKVTGDRKKHSWLFKMFTATFLSALLFRSSLFSTISGILEGSCRLFEDGILTLQRKTDRL